MKLKQVLFWMLGLAAGGFFVWLALQGLDISLVGTYLASMQTGWIPGFVMAGFGANLVRALRWKLMFKPETRIPRRTILAAVLAGYSANIAVPRLGEVSRCGYLAKRTDATLGESLATVVIERAIDMLVLLFLILFTVVFVISDPETTERLLGVPSSRVYQMLAYLAGIIAVAAIFVVVLHRNRERFERLKHMLISKLPFLEKFVTLAHQVLDGLIQIKHLKQWPLFIVYTILMWTGYVAMSYFPFTAIADASLNGLSFANAFAVMVISSIGVVIPSPSGVGTYHFFTQKTLEVIFNVPAEPALAYAILAHAVMLLSILATTGIALLIDLRSIKKS